MQSKNTLLYFRGTVRKLEIQILLSLLRSIVRPFKMNYKIFENGEAKMSSNVTKVRELVDKKDVFGSVNFAHRVRLYQVKQSYYILRLQLQYIVGFRNKSSSHYVLY